MSEKDKEIGDQILDLLLDALLERQREREETRRPAEKARLVAPEPEADIPEREPLPRPEERLEPHSPPAVAEEIEETISETPPLRQEAVGPAPEPETVTADAEEAESLAEPDVEPPGPAPSAGAELGRMLGRLFLALIVLVVLINIPYNRFGTSLARAMPDSAALIIRDGLLLKGSGEKVYVLEDNQRRWITTLDAFEEYGYRWEQVHVVEDAFLEKFEEGLPIHLLLKCQGSPHIYALEDGKKRWIKDIPTFEAQGYVWEDVRFVNCASLREMPDGLPIPEDAGPPPQP